MEQSNTDWWGTSNIGQAERRGVFLHELREINLSLVVAAFVASAIGMGLCHHTKRTHTNEFISLGKGPHLSQPIYATSHRYDIEIEEHDIHRSSGPFIYRWVMFSIVWHVRNRYEPQKSRNGRPKINDRKFQRLSFIFQRQFMHPVRRMNSEYPRILRWQWVIF